MQVCVCACYAHKEAQRAQDQKRQCLLWPALLRGSLWTKRHSARPHARERRARRVGSQAKRPHPHFYGRGGRRPTGRSMAGLFLARVRVLRDPLVGKRPPAVLQQRGPLHSAGALSMRVCTHASESPTQRRITYLGTSPCSHTSTLRHIDIRTARKVAEHMGI